MKEEDVKKIVDQHLDNFKSNILAEKVRISSRLAANPSTQSII